MADWDNIFKAVGGLGAGMAGRGIEWQKQQEAERAQAEEMRLLKEAESREATLRTAYMFGNLVDQRNLAEAQGVLTQSLEQFKRNGLDTSDLMAMSQAFQADPMKARQMAGIIVDYAQQAGAGRSTIPAEVTAFNMMTGGLSDDDRERARRISLGLDPRAVGSSVQTIATTPGLTDVVAGSEQQRAEAVETGKLTAEGALRPQIVAAVKAAENEAKRLADLAIEQRSNTGAYDVFNVAMGNLVTSLDDTWTGPFVGMLPAITAKQQIAKSAQAAMAPVLKQLFRASGEGVFTDRDQQLLLDMVPGREAHPETIQAAAQMIDMIVKAKLKIGADYGQPKTGSNIIIEQVGD